MRLVQRSHRLLSVFSHVPKQDGSPAFREHSNPKRRRIAPTKRHTLRKERRPAFFRLLKIAHERHRSFETARSVVVMRRISLSWTVLNYLHRFVLIHDLDIFSSFDDQRQTNRGLNPALDFENQTVVRPSPGEKSRRRSPTFRKFPVRHARSLHTWTRDLNQLIPLFFAQEIFEHEQETVV